MGGNQTNERRPKTNEADKRVCFLWHLMLKSVAPLSPPFLTTWHVAHAETSLPILPPSPRSPPTTLPSPHLSKRLGVQGARIAGGSSGGGHGGGSSGGLAGDMLVSDGARTHHCVNSTVSNGTARAKGKACTEGNRGYRECDMPYLHAGGSWERGLPSSASA